MADAAVMENGFVHLRVRSAYSLLEGAIKAEVVGEDDGDAAYECADVKQGHGGDAKAVTSLVTAGRVLLEEARAAAGVTDPPRRARTRSVQLLPAAARPMLASEAADV